MHFSTKLIKWFQVHGRHDLPWQKNPNLYKIWISEIMLQQTQVTTVIPYFKRFMQKFPTITKLANAPLDDILSLWAGLGYYARARNLHKSARIIQNTHGGKFPTQFDDLMALPGIGRSTAGALLSMGLQKAYPILDGNVKRVLARYFAVPGWPNDPKTAEKLWTLSSSLLPKKDIHHYTQGIMDLGATLCTRSNPKCHFCPFSKDCKAYQTQTLDQYPGKRPLKEKPIRQTTAVLILDPKHQRIFLEQRPEKGIWSGLWTFPECNVEVDTTQWCREQLQFSVKPLKNFAPFRHTFSHFHLDIHPEIYCLQAPKRLSKQWHTWKSIQKIGVPAPTKRLLESLIDIYAA